MLGSEQAEGVSQQLSQSCGRTPGVEVVARTHPGGAASALSADEWPYQRAGMPALVVTDTEGLRGGASEGLESLESLDFARLTRFVSCFLEGLEGLANPLQGLEPAQIPE
jgi:hypothetical protein